MSERPELDCLNREQSNARALGTTRPGRRHSPGGGSGTAGVQRIAPGDTCCHPAAARVAGPVVGRRRRGSAPRTAEGRMSTPTVAAIRYAAETRALCPPRAAAGRPA